MHLPFWRRLANPSRAHDQKRGERAIVSTLCLHRDWKLGPRHAATGPEQWQAVLRRKNSLHIRFRQAKTLYVERKDVLRKWTRHRSVQLETNQSHFEAIEEKAIA